MAVKAKLSSMEIELITQTRNLGDLLRYANEAEGYVNWIMCIESDIAMRPLYSTHWGRVTHICVNKLVIIGSDNDLSPGRHQAIIWTYAEILLIGPLRTNFNENLIKMHTFSFINIHLKILSGKWWPICLSLNVLIINLILCHFHYHASSSMSNH